MLGWVEAASATDSHACSRMPTSPRSTSPQAAPHGGEETSRSPCGRVIGVTPDHVDVKKTASIDKSRLKVINKLGGGAAMVDFTVEHAERVKESLPARCKTPATRRQYAQLIHRVLALARYPMRLLQRNPLPRGFLPKPGTAKADQWLYPAEDACPCACTIPWRRRRFDVFRA